MNQSPKDDKRGFSLIELLIVVAIILIIAAIAVPGLIRARISANDTAAASTIRTINTAEVTYLSAYPTVGFANKLASLGPGAAVVACSDPTKVSSTSACLIDGAVGCAVATCVKSGYNYFDPVVAVAGPPAADYTVGAGPISWGTSGSQNWCAFEDGVVRTSRNGTGAAPAASITASPALTACSDSTKYGPAQ